MANLYTGNVELTGFHTITELTGITLEKGETYSFQFYNPVYVRKGTVGYGNLIKDIDIYEITIDDDDLYLGKYGVYNYISINIAKGSLKKKDELSGDDTIKVEDKIIPTGKNLLNARGEGYSEEYFINSSGQEVPCGSDTSYLGLFGAGAFVEVEPGKTYTYSSDFTASTLIPTMYLRVHGYNENKVWLTQLAVVDNTQWTGSVSVTIPDGVKYLRCNFWKPWTWMQIEEGSIATTYEPFAGKYVTEIGVDTTGLAKQAPITSKMYNPPLRMDKSTFRVLDIGNSFTEDCTYYMSDLISYLQTNNSIDISNMSFTLAYRGGASYKTWVDCYNDKDTSNYTISKVFGGIEETYNGTAAVGNGDKFRHCLADRKYDLIVIHQVSTYSGESSTWETDSAGGYLKELIRILRMAQPQAHIGFLLTHASPRQIKDGETGTLNQWQRIDDATKFMQNNYNISLVIPAGTAVENLRNSSINQSTHYLTRDGHHIANGLCRYVGTCTYYEAVFAPYFGVSVYDTDWTYQAVTAPSGYESDTIQITPRNIKLGQTAAILAIGDKDLVQNPDGIIIDGDIRPNNKVYDNRFYTTLTLEGGVNSDQLYHNTGKCLSGWWKLSNKGSTSDTIQDCTYMRADTDNFGYIALDKQLTPGSVFVVPAGMYMRETYYNSVTNKFFRDSIQYGNENTAETVVLGANANRKLYNQLKPDKVFVHFKAISDSTPSTEVTVAHINGIIGTYNPTIKELN